ncbi:MAG: hypothetical protein JJU45_20050 [Acidimicrobiia bacterium]|nr:hypothetical protein [Acidimicrobiia bacterium]MCC5954388.1 hypothetical protein [Acidimicrobiia bacterium]
MTHEGTDAERSPLPVDDASEQAADSTEELSVEEEVLEAVQGFWDTMIEAGRPPDPKHSGFERYYTGEALDHSRSRTERMAVLGHVVDGDAGVDLRGAEVTIESPERAQVRHCLVDDAVVRIASTGEVVSDEVLSGFVELDLVLVDGDWRVSRTDAAGVTQGRSGCD